jgi:addiction module HigA family antidote
MYWTKNKKKYNINTNNLFKELYMPKSSKSPGAVLQSLLDQYHLNPNRLGKEIKLSQSAVRQVVIGKARISAPVALRLEKYFGKKAEYWLDLQIQEDLAEAAKDKQLSGILKTVGSVKNFVARKPAKKTGAGRKAAGRPVKSAKKPAGKRTAKSRKPRAKKA